MAKPGRPAMPKPDLHPMVDAFLDMLTTERGAAMNTRQAYWRDLADVSLYLRESKGTDINAASTDDLKAYIAHLSQKHIQRVLTTARLLFAQWLAAFLLFVSSIVL